MALPASLSTALALPVIGSPMFIVSGPDLVIAQCLNGVVGSFPALNARPADQLDLWLTRIKSELAAARAADPKRRIAPFATEARISAGEGRPLRPLIGDKSS